MQVQNTKLLNPSLAWASQLRRRFFRGGAGVAGGGGGEGLARSGGGGPAILAQNNTQILKMIENCQILKMFENCNFQIFKKTGKCADLGGCPNSSLTVRHRLPSAETPALSRGCFWTEIH